MYRDYPALRLFGARGMMAVSPCCAIIYACRTAAAGVLPYSARSHFCPQIIKKEAFSGNLEREQGV